jgi:2-isopropylmalate synthase
VRKDADAYQHIDPSIVGNESRIVISELAGRSSIAERAQQLGLTTNQDLITAALAEVKSLEERGFQFEGAEASFHLLLHRLQDDYEAPFEFVDFLVLAETREGRDMLSEAMVKIRVGDEIFQTASDGNGPVSALDRAARKALERFFPALEQTHLIDYKVRILDSTSATDASVRVLIQSSDGVSEWGTVGSSTDIIEASWLALKDSYEYALLITGSSASDLKEIEL